MTGQDGEACGAHCGHCGRCTHGTPTNAICRACGNAYVRDEGYLGYSCESCVANAHARAERTVEHRHVAKPKKEKPKPRVWLTPDEVCR